MSPPVLDRRRHAPPPALTFAGDLSLTLSRCHELCGAARFTLALMIAARLDGPILWIRPGWDGSTLMARGIRRYIDPGRLIFAEPRRAEDILWSMEEGLRAGCVPLVVAECERPPALTPVRRLHLAAETGAGYGKMQPLGLLLTPGDGGAPGIESRWHLAPRHARDDTAWLLQRRRARMAPPAAWMLRWQQGEARLSPVAEKLMAAE